jgi:hypothetical protein
MRSDEKDELMDLASSSLWFGLFRLQSLVSSQAIDPTLNMQLKLDLLEWKIKSILQELEASKVIETIHSGNSNTSAIQLKLSTIEQLQLQSSAVKVLVS